MRRALFAVLTYGALIAAVYAQSVGGMGGIGPRIGGAGGNNGAPPVGCTNQLVLDYSNSCALVGQGWGE